MYSKFGPVLAFAALASCAHSSPTGAAAKGTAYRVGDRVEYRYAGSSLSGEVVLTERITKVEGNRLTIEVVARRDGEEHRWLQVVTDTPESQRDSVIDELYEVRGGLQVRLPNHDNADIFRLYAWTLPPQFDGKPTGASRASTSWRLDEVDYVCTAESGSVASAGRPLSFRFVTCPDFLWTNGPAEITDESGAIVWSREIVRVAAE
jgi:hypothetical protein